MPGVKELLDALNPTVISALALVISALALLLSTLSSFVSIWFIVAQRRHIVVDQARYIQNLWHKANDIVLKDRDHIKLMTKLWGSVSDSEEETLKAYMIFNQFNPVYTAYLSARYGSMPKLYRSELDMILKCFREDKEWLINFLKERGYSPEFTEKCERRLTYLKRREKRENRRKRSPAP